MHSVSSISAVSAGPVRSVVLSAVLKEASAVSAGPLRSVVLSAVLKEASAVSASPVRSVGICKLSFNWHTLHSYVHMAIQTGAHYATLEACWKMFPADSPCP